MPNQSVCSNDYPFVTTFSASQPWDAPDPLPVMRREMKLLLIEIGQLRTEVEQLRAKEEEGQNVKEFLYRLQAHPHPRPLSHHRPPPPTSHWPAHRHPHHSMSAQRRLPAPVEPG